MTRSFSSLFATVALATTAIVVAQPAAAFNPPVVWFGSAIITHVSSGCQGGWAVGNKLTSLFRPRLQPSEAPSSIAFLNFHTAGVYSATNSSQMKGSGTYNAQSFGPHYVQMGPSTGQYNLTLKPSTVTKNTPLVEVTGTISNFFTDADCTVTIHGGYMKQP